ncbi:von Willebrand factor A domain-containing protein 3B-like [Hemitrygon akajei]|uniref:von Willebrand factor A domain-containing protein 3B-like n=1 Tax=Hemitrygon akajei TaxID=2704970 RepID=UPI003BF9E950
MEKIDGKSLDSEHDVHTHLPSSKWLQHHGLKKSRLTLSQILSQIGFKHREDFDCRLQKSVSSCYGEGLFQQYLRKDGRIYNITANQEQLQQFIESLTKAIKFYQQRLEWLNSGSRQLFGVIQERCITIVLDFAPMSGSLFRLCCHVLCMVLQEQVALIRKINLIRAAEEMDMWQDKAVPVSSQAIVSAVDWIENLRHMPVTSKTSSVEAVLQATSDKTIEAVYFFAAGDGPQGMRELLRQKLANSPCPVHTISFNAKEEATVRFLKELAHCASGRFHAFGLINGYEEEEISFTNGLNDSDTQVPKIHRKLIGGVPPGAGVREDVFLIWSEIEEARNTLAEVQTIVAGPPQTMFNAGVIFQVPVYQPISPSKIEDYITSKKWLEKYGLKARKLMFHDALVDCVFRHSDGVVDIKGKPVNECIQTDAESNMKLVNAKYCSHFAHTQWKDGSVMHVYITAEKCKQYQQKMKTALEQMQRRINWLRKGSRELFGTIIEDQIYILVDTSQSMKDKLELVQRKIFQLMQEQLRHKSKFNFVKFDSRVEPWQEKLADVTEKNIESAWSWIQGLQVGGSTNTLGAIRFALADAGTEAVYLLSDGRPDQPPKTIFAQVQLAQPVPIHSIAFNCDDAEANRFLYELSEKTGGRFHSYNCDMREANNPPPFMSEDICLLKKEIEKGKEDLEKVEKLHAECIMLDWYNNCEESRPKNNVALDIPIKRPAWSNNTAGLHSLDTRSPLRPRSALDWVPTTHRNHWGRYHIYSSNTAKKSKELQKKKVLLAAHTNSSLLRSLSNGVKVDENLLDGWMLPENKELFVTNYNKELKVLNGLSKPETAPIEPGRQVVKLGGTAARRLPVICALGHVVSAWLLVHGQGQRRQKGGQHHSLLKWLASVIGQFPQPVTVCASPKPLAQQQSKLLLKWKWLKTNSLTAKRLTIMDALAPTAVPQTAKYVPVLDKYIVSKVFDQSEDICLLKKEIEKGKEDLEKVEKLHAECIMLDWYNNCEESRPKNNVALDIPIKRPAWSNNTAGLHSLDTRSPLRPRSALDWVPTTHRNHWGRYHIYSSNTAKKSKELQKKKVLLAAHTNSSLLRSLSNGVKVDENLLDGWMLPENKELFVTNYNKELKVLNGLSKPETAPIEPGRQVVNSLDVSSAQWLKTNSLTAKRLTIMDALAPTAVPQTAKYVPVLDKYIVSKVFDQVLPLAHVSSNKRQITLINPLAVNLKDYKVRLRQAIQTYEKRLNSIIWRVLSQVERDRFSSDKPISFREHKEALLQALDRMGWPIPQEDVTLLEDEISTGFSYEQQASDLQKAAKEKELGTLTDSRRNYRPSVKKPTKQTRRILDTFRGQRVIARSEVDGFYYAGIITRCVGVREVLIDFTKGDTQITPTQFVIQIGGAAPCPALKVGDFVLVHSNVQPENDCYKPGVVIATPNKHRADDKFYTVLKYNNKRELSFRNGLIKISSTQYSFISRYIREAQLTDHTIHSVQFIKPISKPVKSQELQESLSSSDEGHRTKPKERVKLKKYHRMRKDSSFAECEWRSGSGSESKLKELNSSTESDSHENSYNSRSESV